MFNQLHISMYQKAKLIDNFVSNEQLFNCVAEAGVIHSGDNTSCHSSIFDKFNLGNIDFTSEKIINPKKVNWSKASEEAKKHYLNTLASKLESVVVPDCVQCVDLYCTVHTEQLEEYTMNVLEAVEGASQGLSAFNRRKL